MIRVIPNLDKSPAVLGWCKRPAARWLLLAVFALLLFMFGGLWLPIIGFLILTTAFPGHRRQIVSGGGMLIAIAFPSWLDVSFFDRLAAHSSLGSVPAFASRVVIAAMFLLLASLASLSFRSPKSAASRRPVLAALLSFSALAGAVSVIPLPGWSRVVAWMVVIASSRMLWFFCYTLTDVNSRHRDPLALQAGLWRPAWMADTGSTAPLAKGAAYLRSIEVKNNEELAVVQIKGVKLLLWALVLQFCRAYFAWLIYRTLHVPTFKEAFALSVARHPLPWYSNCLSVVTAFLEALLQMSVWGHQIIACARMAGFRALRNTYRPLESRTLAEFWNRYYFYFKELLADMFFYPTYLRYFKRHPRLRTVSATMMAACVGNAIFHFLRDISVVAEIGWWPAIAGFQTYIFYCLVLGTGISISQLRGKRRTSPPQSWVRGRLVPALCVAGFYCLIHVFDDTNRAYGLREHFVFLGNLIGL